MKTKINSNCTIKKNNLLICSELATLTTYKKKFVKHPYKKKELPIFFFIKQISFYLKRNLKIIFKYNSIKKKLLLIGEKISEQKTNQFYYSTKRTNHSFVPKSAWMNGLISNQTFVHEHFYKKKQWLLEQIPANFNLTISYNSWDVLNSECYDKRILQIILNTHLELKDYYIKKNNLTYYIPINFKITFDRKIENYFSNVISKII